MTDVRRPAIGAGPIRPTFNAAVMLARVFWAVSLAEGVSFLFMSSLHAGARIPLGFTVVADVPIIQATVVEAVCAILLLIASGALLARRSWAWAYTAITQAFSAAAVLNGIGRVAAGAGPHSPLNDTYHLVILALLAMGFIALVLPPVHRAFRNHAAGA